MLDLLDLLVSVAEVSVALLEGSLSLSADSGLGPPGIGECPPLGIWGCYPQQRPKDPSRALPSLLSELQKSGTTQRELVSQSGPVHIKAIVSLMPSELVYVGTYVTWVVMPDLDILITVDVITDEFEPDVIVLLEGVAATEALEKELPDVEGAEVTGLLLGPIESMPLLELDNEAMALEENFDDDDPTEDGLAQDPGGAGLLLLTGDRNGLADDCPIGMLCDCAPRMEVLRVVERPNEGLPEGLTMLLEERLRERDCEGARELLVRGIDKVPSRM